MLIAAATACADEAADAGGRNVFMYRRSLIRSAAAAGLLPGAGGGQRADATLAQDAGGGRGAGDQGRHMAAH